MTKMYFKDFKLSEELLKAINLLNYANPTRVEAAEKSTVYLIGILILALKMALYQFFKFKSL